MGRRNRLRIAIVGFGVVVATTVSGRHELFEKRVAVVAPGKLVRGAWQRPWPLRRLIDREGIRTIVTLTAINPDDPKYVDQLRVVERAGVDWVLVPMRGSTATLDQLAEAADLLADPDRQPVFFHCVAGHHRTNLALAAYRIRHDGWSADRAWVELTRFPWTEPDAESDRDDRRLIEAFAASQHAPVEESHDVATSTDPAPGRPHPGDPGGRDLGLRRLAMGDGQRRRRRAGPDLSVGAARRRDAGATDPIGGDPDRAQPPRAQSRGPLVPCRTAGDAGGRRHADRRAACVRPLADP